MRWRQVVLLYAVAVALGGWYLAIGGRQPEAPKTEDRPRFLNVDARGLREVRVRRADSVMISRLDAGVWVVVEPKGGFVPSDLIAAFTNALVSAEEIARVADPTDDAKQYGLDERASRTVIVPQSGDEIVVVLGQTNLTGTAVYARRDAAPEVILVGRNIRYYEDLIFEALSAREAPTTEHGAPVGG